VPRSITRNRRGTDKRWAVRYLSDLFIHINPKYNTKSQIYNTTRSARVLPSSPLLLFHYTDPGISSQPKNEKTSHNRQLSLDPSIDHLPPAPFHPLHLGQHVLVLLPPPFVRPRSVCSGVGSEVFPWFIQAARWDGDGEFTSDAVNMGGNAPGRALKRPKTMPRTHM
jgi:hypothetical protein